MSRSGYVEDDEENLHGLYRASVARAIRGKRGQAFLREMAAALDAMPVKELIANDVVRNDLSVCAIGSVALARGLDVRDLDIHDGASVGEAFGIAPSMACEIAFENDDDFGEGDESPKARWQRMRAWVGSHLVPVPSESDPR